MQTNAAVRNTLKTAGGAPAFPHLNPVQQLRRLVLSCMLWESEFYVNGKTIAENILEAAAHVPAATLGALAVEARSQHNLRHVPLLLLAAMAKRGGKITGDTIAATIQRPDELAEFLSIYWTVNPPSGTDAAGRPSNASLSKQVKRGLALAFQKFNAYSLAKYNRDKGIKLRDVLFLVHAKPKDEAQAAVWKQLVEGKLPAPDTWEVELSAGKDKKATFERLMRDGNLGYLAVLRNLRNMTEVGVDSDLIRTTILARKGAERVLPFRYVAAARACPQMEPAIDAAMLAALAQSPKLSGRTVVIIDTSGSMGQRLSSKSDMTRMDAACALGAILRELCEDPVIFATAGNDGSRIHATALVPARRGMALIDATQKMQDKIGGGGIFLKQVMDYVNSKVKDVDRVVVITDEQDCSGGGADSPLNAQAIGNTNYLINVASNRNGIGYGKWTHIDGFSEGVVSWIQEFEREASRTQ